jgi:hypothetical protein
LTAGDLADIGAAFFHIEVQGGRYAPEQQKMIGR